MIQISSFFKPAMVTLINIRVCPLEIVFFTAFWRPPGRSQGHVSRRLFSVSHELFPIRQLKKKKKKFVWVCLLFSQEQSKACMGRCNNSVTIKEATGFHYYANCKL